MINKQQPKRNFAKNVVTLMTGTAIAQAIPIAATPILTRMYSPEDFGVLALFLSIVLILGSVVNGRYELAIVLPESDEDAINIAGLGLLIAVVVSILLAALILVFRDSMLLLLGNDSIGSWLYFIPFSVLMTGFYNVLTYLNIRSKKYKDISISTVYKSTVMVSVQLSVGYIKTGVAGLISGQIASQVVANWRLAKNVKNNYSLKSVNKESIFRLASRYIDFPKYSMWAVLANTSAYNLTNILISMYFSIATLGSYSLAQRLLGMPATLISKAIGKVFFQEATDEKNEKGNAIDVFSKTTKYLACISILIFLPLYFVLPFVFEVALGVEWRIAGEYGQIIIPYIATQFVVSTVTTINSVFEKQIISLVWQLSLLLFSIGTVYISYYFSFDFKLFLHIYAMTLCLHYVVLWLILKRVAHGSK